MAREVIVTRGSQITLTRAEREKVHIKEGDKVIVNVFKDTILISKKNPDVFDRFESFLPSNFKSIIKKLRTDERERLEKLGVI